MLQKKHYFKIKVVPFLSPFFGAYQSLANGLEPVYRIPSVYTEEFIEENYDSNAVIARELEKDPIVMYETANGYRLPNISEFEFVVQNSIQKSNFANNNPSRNFENCHPVTSGNHNEYRLFGLLDNVSEWTNNICVSEHYNNIYRYYFYDKYEAESALCWEASAIGFRLVRNIQ